MVYSVEQLAKVVHEAHRAFCETLGDTSQTSWDTAPAWKQESTLEQVKYHLEHPQASPSASHDSWMEEKKNTGWRYGPEKDDTQKTHPDLIPFEELPLETQAKDRLINSIVRALTPLIKN